MPLAVLPPALTTRDDARAVLLLRAYFAPAPQFAGGVTYTGALFDAWAGGGDAPEVADRFTADDVVAVSFLSVGIPGRAAASLLGSEAERFNGLLSAIGPDRELADVEDGEIGPDWPAWRAHDALRELDGVDWVVAAKLLARKRPRLVPVYDRLVRAVVGGEHRYWEPLRQSLRADGRALQERLLRIRAEACLPVSISAIRTFDIVAWMGAHGR